MVLTLRVLDVHNKTLALEQGEEEVSLVYTKEYEEGDHIELELSQKDAYLMLQMDDALGKAFTYVTGAVTYTIPFGEKRISYSPKVFTGNRHLITAREATEAEIRVYKNLALNVMDQHGETNCYPHAWANVETRGESVFAARNAIDGVTENRSHGEWPYESWGINRQEDAMMTVEFGRMVEADTVVLYTRADFPHDSWWKQVTLSFSDGSFIKWDLEKSEKPHCITFEKKQITWVKLHSLIKAWDPSPFPALSQIEVYGTESR